MSTSCIGAAQSITSANVYVRRGDVIYVPISIAPAVEPAIIDRRALGFFFFSGLTGSWGSDDMFGWVTRRKEFGGVGTVDGGDWERNSVVGIAVAGSTLEGRDCHVEIGCVDVRWWQRAQAGTGSTSTGQQGEAET